MKTLIVVMLACISLKVLAGGSVNNGGDICENRFKNVRNDIAEWIVQGGSASLVLPPNISYGLYNQRMLQQIQNAKISCIDDKIFVGIAEKTCQNYMATDGSMLISCNTNRFMNTSEADQYLLVHHEYAGLAGFEINQDESSNYEISNQLTGYLTDQIVKKLVVRPILNPSTDPFNPGSCQGAAITQSEILSHFAPGSALSYPTGMSNLYQRQRQCNNLTGCGAWKQAPADGFLYQNNYSGPASYDKVELKFQGQGAFQFKIEDNKISVAMPFTDHVARGICTNLSVADGVICSTFYLEGYGYFYESDAGNDLILKGTFTNNCLRLTNFSKGKIQPDGSSYIERERVWLGRF